MALETQHQEFLIKKLIIYIGPKWEDAREIAFQDTPHWKTRGNEIVYVIARVQNLEPYKQHLPPDDYSIKRMTTWGNRKIQEYEDRLAEQSTPQCLKAVLVVCGILRPRADKNLVKLVLVQIWSTRKNESWIKL